MKRKITSATIKYCSIALAGMAFTADAAAACSRESLQALTETYVEAQTTGNATLLPLAASAYYGENDQPMDIAEGMLSQAISADFTRSFFDTTLCATFTEFVAATHEHPYVIHTRMEVNDEDEVSIMESVVTDEGDWVFGADVFLSYTQQEDWGVIPEDQRDMRGAFTQAPGTRRGRPAPWAHSRNRLTPVAAASSLMKLLEPSASFTTFPGLMPDSGLIIRGPLPVNSSGLKTV